MRSPRCFFHVERVCRRHFTSRTTDIAAATTYLLVAKISGASGIFNRVDLYVNPSTLTEPSTPSATFGADAGVASLSHLLLRTAFLDVGDGYIFDEVRVGRSFTSVVSGDGDADGLPDAWEVAQAFDPLSAADAALDFDSDGQTNLTEYRAGTDPRRAASRFEVVALAVGESGVSLEWRSAPGRRYHLQYADALPAWTTLTEGNEPVTLDAFAGDTTTFFVSDNALPPHRFYRVALLAF